MKRYPKKIVRVSDGEIFIHNGDGTYSLEFMLKRFSNHLYMKYDYDVLMVTHAGNFKHYKKKK